MTLEQLRIFVAVAEREHVTQAARELNLTQSAVSAAIAALEARYDTKLFDRIGRRIALTEAGRLFLVEARAVLVRAAAAESVLFDLTGLKRGSLSLAASQTVGNYWLPPVMQRYRHAHPGIALSLAIANTSAVAAMIHDNEADLGFVEDAIDDPLLDIRPVAEDELVLVAAPALAGRRDLKALPWVFREKGSGTRAIFERALTERTIDPAALNVVLELPSNEAVRTAVIDGAGATALSRLAVAQALKSGALAMLDFPPPKRQFFALRLKERGLTLAEKAFYAIAQAGAANR